MPTISVAELLHELRNHGRSHSHEGTDSSFVGRHALNAAVMAANQSGAVVPEGTVVFYTTTGNGTGNFTTAAYNGSLPPIFGVTLEAIASGARGLVAVNGWVERVRTESGTTTGNILRQGNTAGVATPLIPGNTPVATALMEGAFGMAAGPRDAGTGTNPAVLFGFSASTYIKGDPGTPPADTTNTSTIWRILAGSDSGTNDNYVQLLFYRSLTQIGTLGFPGTGLGAITVAGTTAGNNDFQFGPGTGGAFIRASDNRLFAAGLTIATITANTSLGVAMPTPGAVTLTPSASGGTLATGTYYVRVSAMDLGGGESLATTQVSAAVTGPTGSISVSGYASSNAPIIYKVYVATAAGGPYQYFLTPITAPTPYTITTATGTAGTPATTNGAFVSQFGLPEAGTTPSWLSMAGPTSGGSGAPYMMSLVVNRTDTSGSPRLMYLQSIMNPSAASTMGLAALGIYAGVDGSTNHTVTGAAIYGITLDVFNGGTAATTLGAAYGISMNIGANGAGPLTLAEGVRINRYAADVGATTTMYGIHILNLGQSGTTTTIGILLDSQSGSTTNIPIAFANNQGPSWRNAAGNAWLQGPFLDGSNNLNMGIGSGVCFPNGDGGLDLGRAANRWGAGYFAGSIVGNGGITSSSGGAGLGYAAGAGGTVTQLTNKTTAVTLNQVCGQITMNGAALASATSVGFTLNNNTIAATDTVWVSIRSGATADSYTVTVDSVGTGSCRISLRNVSGGSLSEAVVLNYAILKAVAA